MRIFLEKVEGKEGMEGKEGGGNIDRLPPVHAPTEAVSQTCNPVNAYDQE